MDSVGEGEGGKIWESDIETCKISCKKRVASPGSMRDTGCLGLEHCLLSFHTSLSDLILNPSTRLPLLARFSLSYSFFPLVLPFFFPSLRRSYNIPCRVCLELINSISL